MGEPTANASTGQTAASPQHPALPVQQDAGGGARWPRIRTPRAALVGVRDTFHFPGRPRLWIEILLIAVAYWVYSMIRNAVPEQESSAMRHAAQIWELEKILGIAVEQTINHAVDSVTWLIVSMNYYYATLHFIVTIGVLVWLFRCHPGRYSAARLVLFVTTGVALVGYYFYPLAPPRLMNGVDFIDTVVIHDTWGSMASGDLANVSNQYAAMPSMHIGWSLWCGITIVVLAKPTWVRLLGVLYPLVTLVVIVATANHFWLDAVGGAACLGFGFLSARAVHGRYPYAFPQQPLGELPRPWADGASAEPVGSAVPDPARASGHATGPGDDSQADDPDVDEGSRVAVAGSGGR